MALYTYNDISSVSATRIDTDIKAVENSIKNILMTKVGEYPGNPLFGSNIKDYIFDIIDGFTETFIKIEVEQSLMNWEPRVKVEFVKVNSIPEYNRMTIIIGFSLVKDPLKQLHDVTLKIK